MKTLLKLVLAALVAFCLVSPAAAYFDMGDLVTVAYDSTGQNTGSQLEVATDANIDIKTFDFAQENYTLGSLDYSGFAGFENTTAVSLFSAYLDSSSFTFHTYFATVNPAQAIVSSKVTQLFLAVGGTTDTGVYQYYRNKSDSTVVENGSTADIASFKKKINGFYAGLVGDNTNGQVVLADILADGYVDMYLSHASSKSGVTTLESDIAIVRLFADGSILLNPGSQVPVPAAVWMLGSGLLGLVGVRRKK